MSTARIGRMTLLRLHTRSAFAFAISMTLAACGDDRGVAPVARTNAGLQGGLAVTPDVSPNVVYIQFAANSYTGNVGDSRFCTGTFIAPGQLLTAAHCAEGFGPESPASAFDRGTIALSSDMVPGALATMRVEAIRFHPAYVRGSLDPSNVMDLAVVTVSGASFPYSFVFARTPLAAQEPVGAIGYGCGSPSGNGRTRTLASGTVADVSSSIGVTSVNPYSMDSNWRGDFVLCDGDAGGPLFAGSALVGVARFGWRNAEGALYRNEFVRLDLAYDWLASLGLLVPASLDTSGGDGNGVGGPGGGGDGSGGVGAGGAL